MKFFLYMRIEKTDSKASKMCGNAEGECLNRAVAVAMSMSLVIDCWRSKTHIIMNSRISYTKKIVLFSVYKNFKVFCAKRFY